MSKLFRLAVAAVAAFAFGNAYAFHSGGVAECDGCHTMHNSKEGAAMAKKGASTQFSGFSYLLQGSDQSSTCLNCHAAADAAPSSYHIMTYPVPAAGSAPVEMTPGGDFAYLSKTYSVVVRGTTVESKGDKHGHNVVAADYGLVVDPTLSTAPGGTYPANQLHCSSCHDPHGKYRRLADGTIVDGKTTSLPIRGSGSYNNSANPDTNMAVGVYRILGGIGYQPKSLAGSFAFPNTVPAAVAPSTYNRVESATQTRVAYGSGMSEWCANCHTAIHNNNYPNTLIHPAGNNAKLPATYVTNYTSYVKSGDLSGTATAAYSSLVPFEEGSADYTALKTRALNTDAQLGGPDTNSNVSCLSCHRAHASSFDQMVRWNMENEFLTVADAAGASVYPDPVTNAAQSGGRTALEYQKAMYDRAPTKFAPYQRSLCNKCHAKD